ncbi:MAG: cytochrome c biogenesis protein CcsA [Candidatus Lernaella stagnicola]|nr:cytochrome c biogenesis protein CcsA [Candidatus Lernaella stagnicola]
MGALLREIISGLSSGKAYPTSAALFDLAFLVFVVATVGYLVYVATRREAAWKTGFGFGLLAALALTLALMFRWIAAGWAHPPFTNLYESLVFFVWGIIVVYLFVEWRYQVKIAGAFVVPLACLAMGLASLSPNKGIEPLVPALQSVWLHLHVAVASIGYAAFLTAFVFAALFLLKDRVRLNWFIAVAAGFAIFAALAATRGQVLFGVFPMTKIVSHGAEWMPVPLEGGTPGQYEQINLPVAGIFLLFSLLPFLFALLATIPALLTNEQRAQERLPLIGLATAWVLLTGVLVGIPVLVSGRFDTHMAANPYSYAMLVSAWLFALLVLLFCWRYEELLAALPDAKTLDRLGYNSIMVGFPLMTLVIVTGAIWANKAWGRPWGWDPKETASLVTWIIYLLYLHTRLTAGWSGRRSNLVAIVGFLSVVFTYLGVNLLLSGLHAYATG